MSLEPLSLMTVRSSTTPKRELSFEEKIEAEINRATHRRVKELKIELSENGIKISGRAPSYYVKQLAQSAVLNLHSSLILINNIEVTSNN